MGLERLQSIFNNIEDNTQSLEDGIPVESISNSLYDDFHSFGTQGNRSELIEITRINKKQDPSPLMAINGIFVEDAKGNLSQIPINPVNGHNFGQIRINDNAGTNFLQTVNNEHGFGAVVSNNPDVSSIDLGKGDFVFGSLFAHNHSDSIKRPINKSLPGSLKSDLQLYISPINDKNLNIKAHDTYSRRGLLGIFNEPYITHNIPGKDSKYDTTVGGIKTGYNRDTIPWRAAAEDVTRFGAYYTSAKGLLNITAENFTNLAIGDGFTLAEPFGAALLPPYPFPLTGYLNHVQQSKQGKFEGIKFPDKIKAVLKKGIGGKGFELKDIPGFDTVSIRKPGVGEYSKMFNKLSKRPFIAGLQGDTDPFLNTDFTNPIKLQIKQNVEFERKEYIKKKQGAFSARRDDGTPGNAPLTKKEKLFNLGATAGNGIIGAQNLAIGGAEKLRNALAKAAQVAVDAAKEEFNKLKDQGVLLKKPPQANFLGLNKSTEKFTGKFTNYYDVFSDRGPVNSKLTIEDAGDLKAEIEPGDFYVRITDERDLGKILYFRGFVTGITENVNPTWNPTSYIGRSEDVWIYQKGERDLSFNLRVAPANATALENMYEKMQTLTSLVYPHYAPFTDSTRMQPPFTTLYMAHIGSQAVGQFGYIKSLTYTVNEQGDWDALSQLPRVFDIAISYQMLHKQPPQMYPHSRYYNLKADDVKPPFSMGIPIPNNV